jgi:hypothetical protein
MSFGQVANWGVKTVDTVAETKKVVWRPVTATTSVVVGQPVCYNSDLAADVNEKTTNRLASDFGGSGATTYAEGAQTYNARFLVVEEPLTANIHAYAGIVKDLGPLGGADGDTIEIYVHTPGAVVPVYCAQNCVLDRTIMGIRNGQADVDYPGNRAIGVAKETVDRSSTDGLVWMEMKDFDYRATGSGGDSSSYSLIVDDEASSNNIMLESRNYRFDGTGRARAFYYVGELAGAGNSMWGMFKFRTYVNAAAGSVVHGVCANLHFKDDATITVTSGHWNSPLYATVETEVTTTAPTLSGGSVAALSAEYYVDESTAAPANAFVIYVHAGTYNWDGLLAIRNAGDCGDYASTGDAPALATGDIMIPIYRAGSTYYLVALADTGV